MTTVERFRRLIFDNVLHTERGNYRFYRGLDGQWAVKDIAATGSPVEGAPANQADQDR